MCWRGVLDKSPDKGHHPITAVLLLFNLRPSATPLITLSDYIGHPHN